MVGLSKPLSVRLTDEDATFLAGLELDGATTASDKVRALIRLARQRAEAPAGFAAALGTSHDLLAPAARAVRTAEDRVDTHSDVMVGLLTAAEDLLAQALAVPGDLQEPDPARLAKAEAKLVDRAARLAEQLMRWAVTPSSPAYDPTVVADRVASLRDLMRLLTAAPDAVTKEGNT